MTAKYDDLRYLVLKRILSLPEPLSFADLGYLCGPNTIRTMAANGYIDVKISIKPKGIAAFDKEVLIRKKRQVKKLRAVRDLAEASQLLENALDGLPPKEQEAA